MYVTLCVPRSPKPSVSLFFLLRFLSLPSPHDAILRGHASLADTSPQSAFLGPIEERALRILLSLLPDSEQSLEPSTAGPARATILRLRHEHQPQARRATPTIPRPTTTTSRSRTTRRIHRRKGKTEKGDRRRRRSHPTTRHAALPPPNRGHHPLALAPLRRARARAAAAQQPDERPPRVGAPHAAHPRQSLSFRRVVAAQTRRGRGGGGAPGQDPQVDGRLQVRRLRRRRAVSRAG